MCNVFIYLYFALSRFDRPTDRHSTPPTERHLTTPTERQSDWLSDRPTDCRRGTVLHVSRTWRSHGQQRHGFAYIFALRLPWPDSSKREGGEGQFGGFRREGEEEETHLRSAKQAVRDLDGS
ncbi:hypothetical protein MRX96_027612 [Rhipicephalus microplus]